VYTLNKSVSPRALVPDDGKIVRINSISQFGLSPVAIMAHQEKYRAKYTSGKNILSTAGKLKVEEFMQSPSEGEYIDENSPLDTAIHQLISYPHLSLLVTKNKKIVGVLRLSDVFAAAFHAMKESELKDTP